MADYDSESSGPGDVETNVVLGYASKEPTNEPFSQLGGHPTWLDESAAPSAALARCKICSNLMSLILQVRGDLDKFPTHERRLYVWICRRKVCRRKEGSIRAFRAIRCNGPPSDSTPSSAAKSKEKLVATTIKPAIDLGETLFGVKPTSGTTDHLSSSSSITEMTTNPFSPINSVNRPNPFAAASSVAARAPPQGSSQSSDLPETFAQKVRISSPSIPVAQFPQVSDEPWPPQSSFPEPYPRYYIDPETEYIDLGLDQIPRGANAILDSADRSNGSSTEDKVAFESSMDRTFQKFADRLSQNPEQVLRYEYGGQPLLYSKSDAAGKLFAHTQDPASTKVKTVGGVSESKMPRCANCGTMRVFELQLTPHTITELEADEMSVDGMDWGTIILSVCSDDCQEGSVKEGRVGYVEEWVAVQWEELAGSKMSV